MAKKKYIRWDYEKVKNFVECEDGNGCELISEEYINNSSKMKFKCRCGSVFITTFNHFKNRNKGQCNTCGRRNIGDKLRLSYNQVKNIVEVKSQSGCLLLSNEYKNNSTQLLFQCACGKEFSTSFNDFQQGKQQCNNCGYSSLSEQKMLPYDEVSAFVEDESECKLLSEDYVGNSVDMVFECRCGNSFEATFNNFKFNNKRQCNDCGIENRSKKKRLEYDYVKHYIEVESGSGCKLLSERYENNHTDIAIRCECGNGFITRFNTFKSGNKRQCDICSNKINWTYQLVKDFIECQSGSDCKLISGDYKDMYEKLLIQCECGDIFETNFTSFLNNSKRQCNDCGYQSGGELKAYTYDDVKNFIEVESGSGCLLLSDTYINSKTALEFKCKCGYVFSDTYSLFKQAKNKSCPICKERTHWDYDMVKQYVEIDSESHCNLISEEFFNVNDKMLFECSCGSIFETSFNKFKDRFQRKCALCSRDRSLGEVRVINYLTTNTIIFIPEYTTEACKNINCLPFDFAIMNNKGVVKALVEYDGEQHYREVKFWGGKEGFERRKQNDNIKNQYCKDNNIPLLRIPYWDFDNIEQVLGEWLEKHGVLEKDRNIA